MHQTQKMKEKDTELEALKAKYKTLNKDFKYL